MKPINILIVEDEIIIAEDIASYLETLGYNVIGIVDNATDALQKIKTLSPDLILLDISISGPIDGVQVAMIIKQDYGIPFVFLTAFADKQTLDRVKQTDPYGYIVKPFEEKDLEVTIELALYKFKKDKETGENFTESKSLTKEKDFDDYLYVKDKAKLVKLKIKEICWIEAYDNYCFIKTSSEKQLVSYTLKELEQLITSKDLIRVHRSYIVHIHKIDTIENNALYIENTPIPLGKSYKEDFMKRLKFI